MMDFKTNDQVNGMRSMLKLVSLHDQGSHNSPSTFATGEGRAANNNGRDRVEFRVDTDLAGIAHAEPRRLDEPGQPGKRALII